MDYTNHYRVIKNNPLGEGALAQFDTSIEHLTKTEQRRRRLDYLRDSVQQIRTQQSSTETLMIICAIIPILWGFFIIFWFLRRKSKSRAETQIENALEYWGVHEVEIDAYLPDSDSFDSDDFI